MNIDLFIQALYNEPSILNEKGYSIIGYDKYGVSVKLTIRSRKDNRVLEIYYQEDEVTTSPLETLNDFVEELDEHFYNLDKTIKELKGE